ncbi:UxaA family hydrolase [Brucella tritici]|uniref:UxaA family hydrolase n=1 Tax=Brucella tritici TaxID=94626 RepID=A0A833FIA8_9HYPH|nr:UxaA family hydrolase [Brucella tritici]KAB2662298.1 UxaA family hydrolase [Brucella tritici]
MKFQGYRRPDGRIGIRNHVLVIPTVACVNRVAMEISNRTGAATFMHPYGCTFDAEENRTTEEAFIGHGLHPNVGAVLVVSLGCETASGSKVFDAIKASGRPVERLVVQKAGGSRTTSETGVGIVERMKAELAEQPTDEGDLSELIIALECGSSDAFSGLTANPAVGEAADIIVDAGGTVILSELTEMVGAESVLYRRGKTPEVRDELMRRIKAYEIELSMTTEDDSGVFISPGNIEGGLTTIEEKSLGCIYKAGTRSITQVVDYGETPREKGVIIMDTPGYDISSVTGKIIGGAHMVLFTTGKGTPSGSAIAPVLKVSSNNRVFREMPDDIDISAGDILEGTKSLRQMGEELVDLVMRTARGEQAKAEYFQIQEFAIPNVSVLRKEVIHAEMIKRNNLGFMQ